MHRFPLPQAAQAIVLLTAMLLSAPTCLAQAPAAEAPHRHELGVDATSLFAYYIARPFGDMGYSLPVSPYAFTYRYRVGGYHLRLGTGGVLIDQERPAGWYNAEPGETFTIRQSVLALRLGAERWQDIAPRWQVFYGADARVRQEVQENGWSFSNAGYRYGDRQETVTVGGAALLGVRFRITPRFNLITEAALEYTSSRGEGTRRATPLTPDYAPREDVTEKGRTSAVQVQLPFFIVAAFWL